MEMQAKKEWTQPTMDVLQMSETMGGPNGVFADKNGKGMNNGHS